MEDLELGNALAPTLNVGCRIMWYPPNEIPCWDNMHLGVVICISQCRGLLSVPGSYDIFF